jgi:hypothetical protein
VRQPQGDVAYIAVNVIFCDRIEAKRFANGFSNKAWRSLRRVPVIVCKMMKCALSYCPSTSVYRLESDGEVERSSGYLTCTRRYDSCVLISWRADRPHVDERAKIELSRLEISDLQGLGEWVALH